MSSMRWASVGIAAFTAGALFMGCSDEDPDAIPSDAGTDTGVDTRDDTGVGTDSGAPDTAPVDMGVDTANPDFPTAEWDDIKKLSPLPAVPADTTNKYADNTKAAELGQMLFFDKSYSGALAVGDDGTNGGLGAVGDKGKVSCASCHMGVTMDDDRSKPGNVSLGTDFGTRNALSVVNSAFNKWTNWGGRFDSQWHLAVTVAENAKIMNTTRLEVAHMLWNKYRAEYDAIFDDKLPIALDPAASDAARFPASGKPGVAAFDTMDGLDKTIVNRIFSNYGKAIAAYQRKLVSRKAAFDNYVAGDWTAISAEAKRGLKVFIGKGDCATCHAGPNFSDDKFHALLVPQTGAKVPPSDLGRHQDLPGLLGSPWNVDGTFSDDKTTGKLTGLVLTESMKGQFRTKSLRGVGASGPYMHSGQFATLEEVVDYYKKGGDDAPADSGIVKSPLMSPVAFTGTEAADLVAFMKTLTGESIPSGLLMNTAK
jgi:cytochrome c peroxidase